MPGEGIGVEVMAAALAVLDAVEARFGLAFAPRRNPRRRASLPGHRRDPAAGRHGARRTGRRDPLRRDGLARHPLSRRHRDRAAARPALRLRALRRGAADPRHSRRAAGARRSAGRADRPRHRARIDRGHVRLARQGRGDRRCRGARHPGDHARDHRAPDRVLLRARKAAQARARHAGPRHPRRQGERLPLLRLHAQGVLRGRGPPPRCRGAAPLRRRDGARPRAPPLGFRRAADGEPVRRHPLRPRRRAHRRHGLRALGRHRRQARAVPAEPRHRARHRRPRHRQPDGDDPLDGADARLAGERHGSDDARLAARAIETSIDRAFGEARVRSHDIGGSDGTVAIGRAVADAIRSGEADPA